MTADRFYGGTTNRLENLRAFLSFVHTTEECTLDQASTWVLQNTRAGSQGTVERHLRFLDSVGIIDNDDGVCRLGDYGREFHETGEVRPLYDGLAAGVKGFDTILNELATGPMTDEDLMNHLTTAFEEAKMNSPGPAIRHREWLQVLGYAEYDGGQTRLTSTGRALLADRTDETSLNYSEVDQKTPNEATKGDRSAGTENTTRRTSKTEEIVRDRQLVAQLKALHEHRCQLCGDRRLQGPDTGYAQVHHLTPLGEPHNGPDIPENMLVVCPNHHEDFEHGMVAVEPETREITHEYELSLSGRTLRTVEGHDVGTRFLEYHAGLID
jgi:5-methylcytosine-specific restriction endonuclease McrA